MKNLLLAQSGGPSAAINATLAGAVEGGLYSPNIHKIYGAVNGIKGILENKIIELTTVLKSKEALELLCQTPSSALGSCRLKLKDYKEDEREFQKIIELFQKYNIGYFIYIGGNDSMDTVYKLSQYCQHKGIKDIKIMGAPKTIDNDLCETDHCPGFGSAAKYIAVTFSELACDCNVYDVPAVTIVEVMGRNAGWLTASSALARVNGCSSPDLIYVCEVEFDIQKFIDDVKEKLKTKNAVLIAVSEGIKDKFGRYISEYAQNNGIDAFGHQYLSGAGVYLKDIIKKNIGCKVRSIELNLMQRCSSHIASAIDITESKLLGKKAVEYAEKGGTGKMSCIIRLSNTPYQIETAFADIRKIANFEKTIPREWITENGNDISQELFHYLLPLIQGETKTTFQNGVPLHIKLY